MLDFFDDGTASGGLRRGRSRLCREIRDLYERLDAENEKWDELMRELARTERAIEESRELLADMEAMLG